MTLNPRSVLRVQSRLLGEGRHVPVGLIGVSNRRQCPHCRRAHFDPCSALRAWDRAVGREGPENNRTVADVVIGSWTDGGVVVAGELTSIGRGVRRRITPRVGGLVSEPDDSVFDVVELRCAGRLGPGQREHFPHCRISPAVTSASRTNPFRVAIRECGVRNEKWSAGRLGV
jgi:hypothetical protein